MNENQEMTRSGMPMGAMSMAAMDRGQARLPWSEELWQRIDKTVRDETMKTKLASAFLPIQTPCPGH